MASAASARWEMEGGGGNVSHETLKEACVALEVLFGGWRWPTESLWEPRAYEMSG